MAEKMDSNDLIYLLFNIDKFKFQKVISLIY